MNPPDINILAFNFGALLGDVPGVLCLIAVMHPKDERARRMSTLIMVLSSVAVRVINTFTGKLFGWILIPIYLTVVMRYNQGTAGEKLLRFLGGFTLINLLLASLSGIWAALYGASPGALKEDILAYPAYFLGEILVGMVCLSVYYALRYFVPHFNESRLNKIDWLGLAYLSVQAFSLFFVVTLVADSKHLNVVIVLFSTATMLLSVVAGRLLVRDANAAIERDEIEAYTRGLKDSADAYLRHFVDVEKHLSAAAMLRHDLRNQLSVIEELSSRGAIDEASGMLEKLSRHMSESFDVLDVQLLSGEREAPERPYATNDIGARSKLWSVVYVFNLLMTTAFLVYAWTSTQAVKFDLLLGTVLFAAWTLLSPYLTGLIRKAQDLVIAQTHARAARELFEARAYYAEQLYGEVARAQELERTMRKQLRTAQSGIEYVPESSEFKTAPSHCENLLLDALLTLKSRVCSEKQIRFSCAVDVPADIDIEGLDLCAIFSNALDNAIHAAERLPVEERWIELAAAMRGDYLVVIIRNSTRPGKISLERTPTFESHGWGLRILAELVSRHEGELSVSQDESIFSTRMVLCV